MRIIRAAAYKRMPWKNGGGETSEIAISPAGADLATMDWRLSIATVASDGPFSSFPGMDRTLCVLSGALRLDVAGVRTDLTESSPPFAFSGDAKTGGALLRGPVADLNVMTRRERFRHEVRRIAVVGEMSLAPGADALFLFCHAGAIELPDGTTLGAFDTAVAESQAESMTLKAAAPSGVYVIAISSR